MKLYILRLRLTLLFITILTLGYSQTPAGEVQNDYQAIYNSVKEQFGIDPLLMNGIYYENPYYNAKGHPFLGDGEFYLGSVNFRNKKYENVNLKYDIYNQQLIIDQSREDSRGSVVFQNVRYEGLSVKFDEESQQMVINQEAGKPKIMNLLANEFVTEFSMDGMQFKKLALEGDEPEYYQVIGAEKDIQCYYFLYKNRFKSQNEGDRTVFVFSDKNYRSYLVIDNKVTKFRSNGSFLKQFQGVSKSQIRTYLRSNQIKVKRANDLVMKELIHYCQEILDQN